MAEREFKADEAATSHSFFTEEQDNQEVMPVLPVSALIPMLFFPVLRTFLSFQNPRTLYLDANRHYPDSAAA